MFEHTHDKEIVKKAIRTLIRMCRENSKDSNSSAAGAIKEESSNVDSTYFDDIFKDISVKGNENLQQAAKLCFYIAYEIGEFDLSEAILSVISDNRIEMAVANYKKSGKTEELESFIEDLWVCEILAQAKYDAGDKNSAISISKQAIKLNENSRKSWMMIGKVYKEQGFMEDAMDAYLRALQSIPVNFNMIPIYLDDF